MRPFREEDLDAVTAILQTPGVRRWLHLPDDVGREQAWQGMALVLGQWELRNTGQWALEEKASGTVIGRAGSHRPERDDWPGIEIGWAIHEDHWGRGFATEAGAVARDWVFANHDVDAIYSCILEDNLASQGVAKRLGFTPWELRTMKFFPDAPHMIWRLRRADLQRAVT
jgi:RimJ/RimL family protein N-acetyltransferase